MHRRYLLASLGLSALLGVMSSCAEQQPAINRVQAYALPKSLFTGEWFFNQTVIDVPATKTVTFEGETTFMATHRIRWDIQESFLYARAAYEQVQGGKDGQSQDTGEYKGQIVGAWRITGHFDVRRSYNPTTGEEINVLEENASDQKWYDRKYMRVDWSQNVATDYNFLLDWDTFAPVKRDQVSYYDWNSSDPRFKPIFDETGGYIDFTSAMAVAPATQEVNWGTPITIPTCFLYSGQDATCQTEIVKIRNSFLRRDPNRDYQPKLHKGVKDEWFGYFVTERWNWDSTLGITYPAKNQFLQKHGIFANYHSADACSNDKECQAKSPESICDKYIKFHKNDVGTDSDFDGLPDSFELAKGLNAKSADSDGDGIPDGRDDANGNGIPDLEDAWKWDQQNLEYRCTLPLAEREPRPVAYYDTGRFPRSIVCDELENDPTKDGTTEPCKPWEFTSDPKVREEKWSALHLASNTYDDTYWKVYLRGAYGWDQASYEKWIKVKNAEAFGGTEAQQATLAKFGDKDHGWYAFIICPNSPVQETDPWPCRYPHHTFAQAKELEGMAIKINPLSYEQAKAQKAAGKSIDQRVHVRPGDIRYSTVHYAKDYSAVSPLGYGPSAYDARTGEILAGTANIYSAMDWYATYMQEVIDLINGKMSPVDYINGLALDNWLKRIREATTAKDNEQQTTYSQADLEKMYSSMTQDWMKKIPKLGSAEGFEKMKDGLGNQLNNRQLKVKLLGALRDSGVFDPSKQKVDLSVIVGTPLEKQLMDPEILGASGFRPDQVKALTKDVLDQASLARNGFVKKLAAREALRFEISNRRGLDFAEDMLLDEGLAGLAERIKQKFGDPKKSDPKKTWAYLRRLIMRPVVEHEMGHTVGLMHNFGGSDDSVNFGKEYWQLRTNDWQDTARCSKTNPAAGQLCPYFMRGKTNFQLGNDVKNFAKNLKGIEEYSYTSIMDYDYWPTLMGAGLGRYDVASILFGYSDKVEVFKDTGAVPDGFNNPTVESNVFDEYFTGNGQVLLLFGSGPSSYHYTNFYVAMKDKLWDESNRVLVPESKMQVLKTKQGRDNGWYYVDGNAKMTRVPYIYCSHNRANISESCMTWDWGADEWERMKMHIDQWDYWYPILSFTRYRYGASPSGYASRRHSRFYHRLKNFNNTYALYQGLFHQWYSDKQISDFFTNPLDGYGAYTAAMHDAFNAAMRTIAMPDVKGFQDKAAEPDGQVIYSEAVFSEAFATDITNGRYFTTSWYDTNFKQGCGYEWHECLHHMGFYIDKILSMETLSDPQTYFVARDTAEDIRQWRISFFDNFKDQLIHFYGSMLSEDYDAIAPWYDPSKATGVNGITWRNYTVMDGSKNFGPPKPGGGGAVEAATRFTLQLYAAVFGMFRFQGNFDDEFVERGRMWKKGKGTTWVITPTEKIDGTAEYTDPWTGTTYVGVAYKDGRGVAQRMIAHANTLKARTSYCSQAAGPDKCTTKDDRAETALLNYRQLMDVLIQVTTIYDTRGKNWSSDPFDP
jgi:hypothetical protein